MQTPFNPKSPAESFHQPGLEYWFKERRTLIDFRRGPLGRYFDGFAASSKPKDILINGGQPILGKCCQFNAFFIDQGLTTCEDLSESLIDSFLDVYFENLRTPARFIRPGPMRGQLLKRLFVYLVEIKAFEPVETESD